MGEPGNPVELASGTSAAEAAKESVLARVSKQLAYLEKRDSELWLIIVITSTVVAGGLLLTMSPAAFREHQNVHFELSISQDLFAGLIALITLLDVYLVSRWLELRRTRRAVISTTLQSELTRLQSFTDPLTETYNRRSLDEMTARYINHAQRSHKPLTFLMADIDHFKQVNTDFGHLTGDLVIREMASLLKHSVRGCDAVVRYGGDEFLIVLADTSRDGSEKVVERIRRYIEDWNRAGHLKDSALRMSVGVCEWRADMTLDQVLNEADRDMYAAKAKSLS